MARIPTRGLKPGQLLEMLSIVLFLGWLFLKYIALWDVIFGKMKMDIRYLVIPSFILIIVVLYHLLRALVKRVENKEKRKEEDR